MINFFQKIRQQLLAENKLGKYLKYAIGEILLVMIGILLALQVNNWNEEKKLREMGFSLLSEIKSDLILAKRDFQRNRIQNENILNNIRLILNYINTDLPYESKLDSVFFSLAYWGSSTYPPTTSYETLKEKGIDIIENDSLKYEITKIYTVKFPYIEKDLDHVQWVFLESIAYPIITKNVRNDYDTNTAKPIDFEALKKNEEFITMLNEFIGFRKFSITYYDHIDKELEKVINMINEELIETTD